ncbi:hypothetical protein [Thermocoleostomius sinensis]|uniref:Uncharacterized protein n=1 Tax=Thermocoleostomius sinensis A174 TaxID=2016057 RepID=A0A9E8ZE44_9CYAN|nr:hypothetical protein [Thermocoleostomius sinensis]WAL61468.1 hypothetical protein OXH18_05610 [Thermocoleostomius sinensis A174]
MKLDIQLDDEYIQKLSCIQQQTQQDVTEVIKASIDLRYQQLQQTDDSPTKLQQSQFIGSFEAEPDLAANAEAILRSMLQ